MKEETFSSLWFSSTEFLLRQFWRIMEQRPVLTRTAQCLATIKTNRENYLHPTSPLYAFGHKYPLMFCLHFAPVYFIGGTPRETYFRFSPGRLMLLSWGNNIVRTFQRCLSPYKLFISFQKIIIICLSIWRPDSKKLAEKNPLDSIGCLFESTRNPLKVRCMAFDQSKTPIESRAFFAPWINKEQ